MGSFICWLIYGFPLLLFIFCPTIQFPWNPMVPLIVFRLHVNHLHTPSTLGLILGVLYDCLLPSPRVGFYAFAFTLASMITSRILRIVSMDQAPFLFPAIAAIFLTLIVNMLAHSLSALFQIPSKEALFSANLLILQPLITGILTCVLQLIFSLFSHRRTSRA